MSAFSRQALLFIVLAELMSLFGFLLPQFGTLAFWVIAILFLIISLSKLEWGLYILLVELFIGSKGYLFSFESNGIAISIRLAIFIIFLSVWLSKLINQANRQNLITKIRENKALVTSYLSLITIAAIGIVNGLLRAHSWNNIFFDFNGWLYFALFLPFLDLIRKKDIVIKILHFLLISAVWTSIKTLSSLYLFSHQYFYIRSFYKWLRDTGVGEITIVNNGFSRIFFQSHIYVLIAFFIVLTLVIGLILKKSNKNYQLPVLSSEPRRRIEESSIKYLISNIKYQIILALLLSAIITSLSRSFWVGLIAGLTSLLFYLIFKERLGLKNLLKIAGIISLSVVISFALLFVTVKLPPDSNAFSSNLIENRLSGSASEVAGSSRLNQLQPLAKAILKHPVIGSGFGAVITYKSEDLRIKTNLNPEGWYTTYAFEWGYLDILLKLGLLGLIVYLYFIFQIVKCGYKFIIYLSPEAWKAKGDHLSFNENKKEVDDKCQMSDDKFKILSIGLIIGLVALLATNIFSPYLNHPLGIGYVLFCAAIISAISKISPS